MKLNAFLSSPQSLRRLLTRLGAEPIETCAYAIPTPPAGSPFIPSFVKLRVTAASGTYVIPHISATTECAPDRAAWFFDKSADPTRLILCAETCQLFVERALSVDTYYGCATVRQIP